jgi:diamine N-acetyltransferase
LAGAFRPPAGKERNVTKTDKSLEELVRELPPELCGPVRDGIEALLERHAPRAEEAGPPEPLANAQVSLREVTGETVRTICRLSDTLTPPKRYMVAPNAVSIAEAHFEPKAWFRAIYADETPVGFIMLYDDAEEPMLFLWRLMVATPHQGNGYGRRAVELLLDYVEKRPGATELLVSCGEGAGSPEGFYHRLGFRRNGKVYGDEVGLVLPLAQRNKPIVEEANAQPG